MVFLASTSECVAEDLPSGLYTITTDSTGRSVSRADTDGQVNLGDHISPQFRDATIVSQSNDNSGFRLSLTAAPVPEGWDRRHMAVVVAGQCIPPWGTSDRRADGSISLQATVQGREAADQIAAELHITPQLRTHPGQRIAVTFRTEKPSYHPGEAVNLLMTIRNVGQSPLHFIDGGSNRGYRDNQFGFTSFHNSGTGHAVQDIGDPMNYGGKGSFKTIAAGGVFTKTVELSRWFRFDAADTYQVTGAYKLPIWDADFANTLWDDFAVGTCFVDVNAPKATTKPSR